MKKGCEEKMGVLQVKNVSYYYSKNRMVVDGVSEDFESGKMYVILGPSGCGKTTLLSLLGGLDVPKEGRFCLREKRSQRKIWKSTGAATFPSCSKITT